MPEPETCVHCKERAAVGECCSAHRARLCHTCYRVTHFVEVCGEHCSACRAEGLPRIYPPRKPGGPVLGMCIGEWSKRDDDAPAPAVMSGNDLPPGGLLTPNEQEAISLAGRLAGLFSAIIGDAHTREDDTREVVHHVHAIQNAVLAQAAARAYPDTYRLMGESFYDAEGNRT